MKTKADINNKIADLEKRMHELQDKWARNEMTSEEFLPVITELWGRRDSLVWVLAE